MSVPPPPPPAYAAYPQNTGQLPGQATAFPGQTAVPLGAPQSGYPVQQAGYVPPPPMGAGGTIYVHKGQDSSLDAMKNAVPSLPMCLAITFLCINCILPGFGTIFAGFAALCCAETKGVQTGKCGLFCINFWCGIAQLLLVVFAIGWIWSIMWGVLMIHESTKRNNQGGVPTSPQQY